MESDNVAAPSNGGFPSMRAIEHIGLTVPNIEEATEFLVNVLGCEEVYTMGPAKYEVNWIGLDPAVFPQTVRTIRTVSCHNGPHFELFEFTMPGQQKQIPNYWDIGGSHVAFYVDDMDTAIAYLKSKGVEMLGEKKYGSGPEAGKDSTFIHFKTPWGQVFELVSYPNGRAYEQEKPAMWRPTPPNS